MKLRYTALALAGLIALTALAASQSALAQAPLIERVKLTDNEMSCQMIYGEIKQMEAFAATAPAVTPVVPATPAPVAEAVNPVAAQLGSAVATQAVAQAAARSGFGGLFGGLINVATQATAQPNARPQQLADVVQAPTAPVAASPALAGSGLAAQASARKEYLTSLFLGKGCKLSEVQR